MKLSAKRKQKVAWTLIWAAGIITVLILLLIIGYVFVRGITSVTPSFLFTEPAGGLSGGGGISTVIVSTILLVVITMVIATPLGLGAAIYLAEYAPDNWLTKVIRYGVETLAGVPSIIFGLFGFALFVTILNFSFSILAGALTLACLVLPTFIRTAEEAIKTVPRGQREASLALGATKWQTMREVVLPAALPGIVTAVILCVGRAVEETACLYVTMGGSAAMPTSFFDSGRSLSLHLFYLATETNAFEKAMATGVVLIVIIIVLNGITTWLAHRFQAKMGGRIV
jgi:phosphate transport system permease protein